MGLLSGLRALDDKLTAAAGCSRFSRGTWLAQHLLAAALAVATAAPIWAQSHPSIAQSTADPSAAGPQLTASGSSIPDYQLDRSEEDWCGFDNANGRDDLWDPLKCVGLGRPFWCVSLGAELRAWCEVYRNYNWGSGPQDSNGYYLNRITGDADFHLGPSVRIFAELRSGLEFGRNGGVRLSTGGGILCQLSGVV